MSTIVKIVEKHRPGDNLSGVVEGDRIVEFRVNAKLSFLEGHK